MMFAASAALLLKLWYIDRMVFYYEQHRDAAGSERSSGELDLLIEGEDRQEG